MTNFDDLSACKQREKIKHDEVMLWCCARGEAGDGDVPPMSTAYPLALGEHMLVFRKVQASADFRVFGPNLF